MGAFRAGRCSVLFAAVVMTLIGALGTERANAVYQGFGTTSAPWAAFVQNHERASTCTGSFVTPTTVLTALHCVARFVDGRPTTTVSSNVSVAANPTLKNGKLKKENSVRATSIVPWGNRDVAVIELGRSISGVTPIALAPPRVSGSAGLDLVTSNTIAYGFGATDIVRDLPPVAGFKPILQQLSGPVQFTPPGSYVLSPAVCGAACVRWDRLSNGPALLPGDSGGPWTAHTGAAAAGAHTTNIVQFGVSSEGTTTKTLLNRGFDYATVMDVTDPALARWIADAAGTVFASGGVCPAYNCLLDVGTASWHVKDGFARPIADPSTRQCLVDAGVTVATITADELAQVAQIDLSAVCAPPAPLIARIAQAFGPVDLALAPYTPADLARLVAPLHWAVTAGGLPVGMGIDSATGVLSGAPSPSAPYLPTSTPLGFGQTHSFTVTVSDDTGQTATASYELFVTERRIDFVTAALPAVQLCAGLSVPIEAVDLGYGGSSWRFGASTSPELLQGLSVRSGGARNLGLLVGTLRPAAVAPGDYTVALSIFGGHFTGGSATFSLTVTAQDPVVGSNCQFVPANATVGAPPPCPSNCTVLASIADTQLTVEYPGGRCVAVSPTLPATVFTPAVAFYYWDGVRAFRLPFGLGSTGACTYTFHSSDGLYHLSREITSGSIGLDWFTTAGVLPGGQVFAAAFDGPVSEPPLGVSNVVAVP